MSSIQDVSAEQLAKLLHHYREALAEDFECNSIEDDERTWDRASEQERKLMVAAARLALLELAAGSSPAESNSKYFAKPGEADWGC
jgi:hypothetical protein